MHDLWALRLQKLQKRLKPEVPAGSDSNATATDTDDDLFSSQEINEIDTQLSAVTGTKSTTTIPNLKQALAIMHLAFQMLRLPFLLADMLHWAQLEDLPYQDAHQEVPKEMLGRLPQHLNEFFRPKIQLTDAQLLFEVRRMAFFYNKDFGLEIPPLNLPPLTFRLIEELALPLEVYPAVRRMAVYIQYDFKYGAVEKDRTLITDVPEAQLIACLIGVIKIFYPLTGPTPVPSQETSPAAAVLDWDVWEQRMSEATPLEYLEAIQMTDREAIDLQNSKVDEYFDFFQEHFTLQDPVERNPDADFRRTMLELFPVQNLSDKSRAESIKTPEERKQHAVHKMQQSLRPNRVITTEDARDLDEKVFRPGTDWVRHKNTAAVTGRWKVFYNIVSKATGIPYHLLVDLMIHFFNQLMKLRRGIVKKRRLRKGHGLGWLSKERLNTEDMASDVRSDATFLVGIKGSGRVDVMEDDILDAQSDTYVSDVSMEDD